jgi:mono/diheme cytochrome c family protein
MKALKVIGIILGVVLLFVIISALTINIKGIPSYEVEKISYTPSMDPEQIAHGRKMAMMLCANCHMNTETGKLTGKLMSDAPPEFGTVYAPNITQDKEVGIGTYSPGELVYLLRTGIKRTGEYAPPYMAKLPNMADSDMDAIISFLMSDDPMVAADATPDQPCEPSFLTKVLCNTAFKPYAMPDRSIPRPDPADPVELGRYLVHNLDCYTCHSADFKSINFEEPTQTPGYLGGGNVPLNMEGEVMLTSNITPHKETGIGNWSEEKFVKALKTGQLDGEPALRYPMMPYTLLSDQEARAIYKYLMTVPPIKNEVKRSGLE